MSEPRAGRRAVVLVDAEHHPEAVRAALTHLEDTGNQPVLVIYVGGSEKVDEPGRAPDLGYPTVWPTDALTAITQAIADHDPDVVIDRTADPVVDDRRRQVLAATALAGGASFEAPGASYAPLSRPAIGPTPSVGVIATGKRTGKTALAGAFARHTAAVGRTPCVLAMGRGGPAQPVVIPAGSLLRVEELAAVARGGAHAASDFYEDAVMTGVATIGCRRVGEGPTGEVGHSNVPAGVDRIRELDVDLAILEGSGAAIPPAHTDATMLIVPATLDPVDLHAMLPLRFLLADLVVVTMADDRLVNRTQTDGVRAAVDEILRRLGRDHSAPPVVETRFRPTPLASIEGRRVVVATTAPESVGAALRADLAESGAEIVTVTHALSNRPRLRAELENAPPHDLLLTELKAAAIDVAAAFAERNDVDTMFYDNRPELSGGARALGGVFDQLLGLADQRAAAGHPPSPGDHLPRRMALSPLPPDGAT